MYIYICIDSDISKQIIYLWGGHDEACRFGALRRGTPAAAAASAAGAAAAASRAPLKGLGRISGFHCAAFCFREPRKPFWGIHTMQILVDVCTNLCCLDCDCFMSVSLKRHTDHDCSWVCALTPQYCGLVGLI